MWYHKLSSEDYNGWTHGRKNRSRTSRKILKGKIYGSQTTENPEGQIHKPLDKRCQNTARDGRMEKTGITPEYLGEN
jgi:hypothetical protein